MALTPATLIPLSLTYVLDITGRPIVGAQMRVYQAGTLNPAVVFADAGLTAAMQQPVLTTGSGRFPAAYIGPGFYRYRVLDQNGVVLDDLDGIEGAVVTQETVNVTNTGSATPTGALQPFYGLEVPAGWVRANGRTISNAVGGGTELADPTTQALFVALWDADPNLAVSAGRGNTAIGDFNAGKQIALPDLRRRLLAGLDGMGNGLLNPVGDSFSVLGARFGEETHGLTVAEMPSHTHIMSCDTEGGHIHSASCDVQGYHSHSATADVQGSHTHAATEDTQGNHTHGATMDTQGDHNHAASLDAQGIHSHQATSESAGDHNHQYTRTHYNSDGPVNSNYSSYVRNSEVNDTLNTSNAGAHTHQIDVQNSGLHIHNVVIQNAGAHVHNITIQNNGSHQHNITVQASGAHSHNISVLANGSHQHNIAVADAGEHTHVVTAQPVGGSAAHNNLQPTMPVTVLIKL